MQKESSRVDRNTFYFHTCEDGYSDRVKDIDQFVSVPESDPVFDYGIVSPDVAALTGMQPLPVRLVNGVDQGMGRGYGIIHIFEGHGETLARFGYYSVQDYVLEVARNFDAVYSGRGGRWILVYRKCHDFALDRQLIIADMVDHYGVVTGFPRGNRRRKRGAINGVLQAEKKERDGKWVWESAAPDVPTDPR